MLLEDFVIETPFTILSRRLKVATISVSNSDLVEKYLLHKLISEEREIFGALWLDVKNRIIEIEDISMGTINTVCAHPREILKSALKHNAANVIFYHNHPTGEPAPSEADKVMTADMKKLLHVTSHPEIAELVKAQREIDQWYVSYADSLSDAQLDELVEFEFIGGGKGVLSRSDILLHVVNHTTYHRGHAADILYNIKVLPPTTDFPVFLREMANSKK